MLRSPLAWVTGVVVLWFAAAFLVLPNVVLLGTTFFPDGEFSLGAIEKLLRSERAMRTLGNSFLLAVTLSITVNVVGVFIVLVTQYFRIRGARLLWLGYATTLIYGGIVLAAGYNFIYGRFGFVTNLMANLNPDLNRDWFSGYFAVVFVMTFATTTNHMLFLSSSLAKVDYASIEAAKLMGASSWTILRRIVLPVMKPMLFAVTVLTFLIGLGALTAPLVLGGPDFQTVAPLIIDLSRSPITRDIAALLAIILGVATIILLAIMNRAEKSGVYFSVAKVATPIQKQPIRNPVANVVVHVIAYLLWVIYLIPVVLIVVFSFVDARSILAGSITLDSFTLQNYITVFSSAAALRPFLVSVVYSALASVVVVGGLLFVARMLQKHRNAVTAFLEYVLHIPWILPIVLIALGLVMAFDRPQALVGNIVLTGTPVLLLIAYISVKIPFTLRLLKAAFASVPDSLEDASRILGARSLTTFRRVLIPLVLPTAAAITALNFNSLLDDYDAAIFLYHPLYPPLGVAIQESTRGENNLDAMPITFVYTVLLMVIMGVTMYLVYGRGSRVGAPRRVARRARSRGSRSA
ncbi:ABC transporter permease [Microbacterium neungamense]|uniref:ABC transporter permease n=1 Tax=Microbacterium TaxID=33882 RepID=UPI00217EF58F|nr:MULTISPECIES: iron ABC transporter permease [Microbacterium]UWF78558.1 iron ABC transporter permease [Microbacterium neungamense]WCM56734.1 iron ABC transporter permease [Microbacterium sp. EF45047]